MADSLVEARFKTVNDILVDVKAEALVYTLADTAAVGEVERLGGIVVDVETTALVDTVADKMAEAEEQDTHWSMCCPSHCCTSRLTP